MRNKQWDTVVAVAGVDSLWRCLQVLALPISCDASMPDYIVKADIFDRGMKRHWHRSDRFRMFFATSYGHKAGGTLICMHRCKVISLCIMWQWDCSQWYTICGGVRTSGNA